MEKLLEGILVGVTTFGFIFLFCILPNICMGVTRIGKILVDALERKINKKD